MKSLLVSIFVCALTAPIFAQAPNGWMAHGDGEWLINLTPSQVSQMLAQVTFPQAPAAAQPVAKTASIPAPTIAAAAAPALPTSNITYLPQYLVNAGAGATIPGSGRFAFWSVSTYLGQQTYATAATEYTISKGQVSTCALAGVSKVMYQYGALSIGLTGLGGGCTNPSGSSPAASAQGFASLHFGKSSWSAVITGMKTSGEEFKLTLSPQKASQ